MTDALLIETAEKVFTDTSTYHAVQDAQHTGWAPAVWDAAAAVGLPWIGVPEAAGGVGGSLRDAIVILQIAGRHAAPIPLAETGVLAGWLLGAAGLQVADGPLSVIPGRREDDLRLDGNRLSGSAHRVPWGRSVARLVAVLDGHVVVTAPARATRLDPMTNVAGEPRDTLHFDRVTVDAMAAAPEGVSAEMLRLRGALTRAALMSGALQALARMTETYTAARQQFGRPIGSFQAVQAHVVTAAEEAALVDVAVQAAAAACQSDHQPAWFEIASAKLVANHAALVATRAAHQAHGAIGMTQEYPLHQFSRRLWAWRAEFGDSSWASRLGQAAVALGPEKLYYAIADGSASAPAGRPF
jgi:acyl-CoA dehydrogenase